MKNGQRLKVGLVFDDTLDSSDGVAQYVKTLGAWLSVQGHHVTYLVGETRLTSWHGGRVYSLAKNIRVSFNGNRLSIPLPAGSWKIKQLMAAEKFDLIHVMVPYSPFLAAKVIKSVPEGGAIVGTFHIFPSGALSKFGSKLLRLVLARTLSRFGRIVSVSPAAADFAQTAYRIKTEIIPNTVDMNQFKNAASQRAVPKTIVFLGRLVERKGAKYLIEAFSLLSIPDARLIIAGSGPQRNDLEKLASNLGIKDKVRFLGFVEEADKPALLSGADIACFPSLYGESFGIVLIEAMAAGSGVVLAGDNPGYRSVLGERPELLVDPRNTKEFAERLSSFLTNNQQARQINVWQSETVKQYDIAAVGPRILKLYSGQIARLAKKSNNKTHG